MRRDNKTVRQARTRFGATHGLGEKGIVTLTLIGLNVAVFLFTLMYGTGVFLGQVTPLHAAFSFMGINGDFAFVLADPFGQVQAWSTVAGGGYYRYITSMFLHYGALHLLMNMVVLWIIGRVLEKDLGPARFLSLYLISGLFGGLLTLFFSPTSLAAGASGAIFGLFGALLLVNRKLGRDNFGLYVILALNLVITFGNESISATGHIGGFIGGLLCGAVLTFAPREKRAVYHWVGFGLLVVAVVMLTLVRAGTLLTGATTVT
ncbi:rhomboid family intramembrane serine protease [Haloglycomyces albus]|uniref:rhomboid family intramembrane serine protease n=1 Tax=Haloglycomyces albus TaxID=526067 RepID=UPI0004AF3859|nr:rhomboid family intramembrane serine protease [Haloglycomyces albus]